ncbi:MAG: sulfite exporter TauE/SafE family protein [Myxococcaceae bacterium]
MSLVALGLLVFFAFLVEAAAGFGSMVIALTVGALWAPVDQLLVWLVPVNLVLSCWLVARGWGHIDWRFALTKLLPLMGVGLGVGLIISSRAAQATWVKPVFGAFVVAVSVWQLRGASEAASAPLPLPTRVLALVGAGVIHGLYATGGPLAVFVSARELPEKARFRATLSLLWVVLNIAVIARFAFDGKLTTESLGVSAWMLLPLGVGIAAGEWVHHRLDERRFRVVVAALLLVAGLVLTINSLRAQAGAS